MNIQWSIFNAKNISNTEIQLLPFLSDRIIKTNCNHEYLLCIYYWNYCISATPKPSPHPFEDSANVDVQALQLYTCYLVTDRTQSPKDHIQNLCDTAFDCDAINTGALNCTAWEKNNMLSFNMPTCSKTWPMKRRKHFAKKWKIFAWRRLITFMVCIECVAFHVEQKAPILQLCWDGDVAM